MSKKLTTQQFIEKAQKVHENKYDYSLVEYKASKYKVKIICKEHGVFEQGSNDHLQGRGCSGCGYEKNSLNTRKTKEEFVKQANKTHNSIYNYTDSVYSGSKNKIKIGCSIHGDFWQDPNNHLQGTTCPKCGRERIEKSAKENPTGWAYTDWQKAGERSKNFDSFKVYVIRCWNGDEEFYKIGKTFLTMDKRFPSKSRMPYNYEIIEIFQGSAREMSELEHRLQKENKSNKYVPKIEFKGMQECYIHKIHNISQD